jgi:hypothetical protein
MHSVVYGFTIGSHPKNEYCSVVRITEAVVTVDADMIHGIWMRTLTDGTTAE